MELHDVTPSSAGPRDRALRAGIHCLELVAEVQPGNWAAHWMRGKGHQALDDHRSAAAAFREAYAREPGNPDVGRELVLSLLELGAAGEAVPIARAGVALSPGDAGLRANLALVLLLDAQVGDASSEVDIALSIAPADPISQTVRTLITEVQAGSRAQPSSLRDLQGG
ncbi:MAG: Flp pilus assembly protein TadD [Myxococcota bacterium]|jgi:Flp pilus assembly protein TadD